jgi:hypothetical protein
MRFDSRFFSLAVLIVFMTGVFLLLWELAYVYEHVRERRSEHSRPLEAAPYAAQAATIAQKPLVPPHKYLVPPPPPMIPFYSTQGE